MTTTKKENTSMIPARGHWVARFKTTGTDGQVEWDALDVEAWSDDREPMIVSRRTGRLVPANGCRGFVGVEPRDDVLIGVVPGQGWTVQRIATDGQTWADPVIAFAIDRYGSGQVITATADGMVIDDPDIDGKQNLLTPPGGWVPTPATTEEKTA